MGEFKPEKMVEALQEKFSDTYVRVEQDGDSVVLSGGAMGIHRVRREIEDEFDGDSGAIGGLVDKFLGVDVVAYEDFDIETDTEDNEVVLSPT